MARFPRKAQLHASLRRQAKMRGQATKVRRHAPPRHRPWPGPLTKRVEQIQDIEVLGGITMAGIHVDLREIGCAPQTLRLRYARKLVTLDQAAA